MTSLPPPLSERDASVVRLVGRFRQLTSRHIRCVLFADVTEMPVNRSLRRLLAQGYLTRIPRVFGDGGGSATVLLEAETGSHVLRSLDNKCRAYWQASRAYGDDFPTVLFALPDAEHMQRVRNAANAGPDGSAALFDVR